MRNYARSFCFACNGFFHAVRTERNLKLFVAGYVGSILVSLVLQIDGFSWAFILFSGGTFLAIELLNTALEHFSDAFDSHSKKQDDIHYAAIKATKDIAAAAALVSALAWVAVSLIVLLPPLLQLLGW